MLSIELVTCAFLFLKNKKLFRDCRLPGYTTSHIRRISYLCSKRKFGCIFLENTVPFLQHLSLLYFCFFQDIPVMYFPLLGCRRVMKKSGSPIHLFFHLNISFHMLRTLRIFMFCQYLNASLKEYHLRKHTNSYLFLSSLQLQVHLQILHK
jgi:hypothetical protein